MRRIVHHRHQLLGLVNDGRPLPPRQHRCEEPRYLNVLLLLVLVRNGNRIVFDKTWTVELFYLRVKEILQVENCRNGWV